MGIIGSLLILGGMYPLWRAWRAAQGSTIRHPLAWAFMAWAAWALAAWQEGVFAHWLALCLTACAGVAVLNARRPHAVAWHFVVAGLLLLLLRPAWEGMGKLRLDGLYVTALTVALSVALSNYLPTRLGLAAVVLGGWCALDLLVLTKSIDDKRELAWPVVAAVPWLAWLSVRGRATEFDARWRTFRDRFGFVWAALGREMFNNAARHANLGATLHWSGLRGVAEEARALALLRGVVGRFEEASQSE